MSSFFGLHLAELATREIIVPEGPRSIRERRLCIDFRASIRGEPLTIVQKRSEIAQYFTNLTSKRGVSFRIRDGGCLSSLLKLLPQTADSLPPPPAKPCPSQVTLREERGEDVCARNALILRRGDLHGKAQIRQPPREAPCSLKIALPRGRNRY